MIKENVNTFEKLKKINIFHVNIFIKNKNNKHIKKCKSISKN